MDILAGASQRGGGYGGGQTSLLKLRRQRRLSLQTDRRALLKALLTDRRKLNRLNPTKYRNFP